MTGFWGKNDPEPPRVDVRMFRGGCHAAALAAGGTVESIDEAVYPRGYHTAVVATPENRAGILCHAGYPLIAFVADSAASWLEPRMFRDSPAWAEAFAERGFTVMGRELLESPLTAVDTSALTKAEWRQIHGWKATTVGETVFNGWD
ncbi:hypothetical protein [Actinoplanes utahensis]|uniref:hypothetical protein n=1 Tax=Actinoplanes utahensis TaxID=1869 RepID=UPI001269FBD6|nr:hypothetical protein [Actinoplanes utahensis]